MASFCSPPSSVNTVKPLSLASGPTDSLVVQVTPTTFAPSPLKSKVLLAFLILSESNNSKTVRVLYSNPSPKHIVTNRFPVQRFVFPAYSEHNLRQSLCFTFTMTTSTGERVYGHTLHTVTGEAMVCLSAHTWCGFFQQAMHLYRVNGAEEGQRMIRTLLDASTDTDIPHPNADTWRRLPASIRTLPAVHDAVSPYVDSCPASLLHTFTVSQLFEVVAAILTERRVIVVGPTHGSVSNVMISLLAVLAPFEYQHTLITILPEEMALVLAAPTPYFVGLVESQLKLLEQIPGIEGIVIIRLEFQEVNPAASPTTSAPTSAPAGAAGTSALTSSDSSTMPASSSQLFPPPSGGNSSSDFTHMEPKLICQDIFYHEETEQTLPRTGRTESRIRWQLELLRRSPQMRRTSVSFEMDAAEQYRSRSSTLGNVQGTSTSSPHDIICQVFCSYYASWLGPYVADFLLKRRSEQLAAGNNSATERTSTAKRVVLPATAASAPLKAPDAAFFEALLQSQTYYEAMSRLCELLDPAPPATSVAASRSGSAASSRSTHQQTTPPGQLPHAWFSNPFLVSLVQQNPTIFVAHHEELSHPVSVLTPSPRRQHATSSANGKAAAAASATTTLRRAQHVAKRFNDNIRVRSLLLRSIACCRNDDGDSEEELNDLTPVSGNSSV